jgi:hypothetical protein
MDITKIQVMSNAQIADSSTSALKYGNNDIMNFVVDNSRCICIPVL